MCCHFDQGQGFSRSLQVTATGALWKSIYNFLFIINGNFGLICKHFQVRAPRIMLDLLLTSSGHVRPKPMAPFEREPMTSYSILMVTLALSASVSKLQPPPPKYAWPPFDLFRSREVQANGAIWEGTHDFLFNINGNHGPICKRFWPSYSPPNNGRPRFDLFRSRR